MSGGGGGAQLIAESDCQSRGWYCCGQNLAPLSPHLASLQI